MEDLGVLLSELAVVKSTVGDSFAIYRVFISYISSIETIRVLDDDIQPDVLLNLANQVCESTCRNAFNGSFILWERFEKADDTLTDSNLFPLLVDVCLLRVEVQDLHICELFFGWLLGLWHQGGVHNEDWADWDLAQKLTLLLQSLLSHVND